MTEMGKVFPPVPVMSGLMGMPDHLQGTREPIQTHFGKHSSFSLAMPQSSITSTFTLLQP